MGTSKIELILNIKYIKSYKCCNIYQDKNFSLSTTIDRGHVNVINFIIYIINDIN